jgi:(5-formylfuran-3-yl)methyl phosphate synthase
MEIVRRTARLLASVTSETEALLCAHLAADIIDAKNPAAGALGALPHATVKAIRARVPRHVPVSATIGDPTDDADATARAVVAMAATGVDIVKVGLNSGAGAADSLSALARLDLAGVLLVGVLLADRGVDLELVKRARDAGFAGLMLDTADKKRGALPDVVPAASLQAFVAATHGANMFAGLAGSLRADHVADLLEFSPDVLGFRGGLCRRGDRTATLDPDAVRAVRRAVPFCDSRVPLTGGIARRHQAEDVA